MSLTHTAIPHFNLCYLVQALAYGVVRENEPAGIDEFLGGAGQNAMGTTEDARVNILY